MPRAVDHTAIFFYRDERMMPFATMIAQDTRR
jgi:hypothetical protein